MPLEVGSAPCISPLRCQLIEAGMKLSGKARFPKKFMWVPCRVLSQQMRHLRWAGDSQRESGRFARIDSQKIPILIMFERFARIVSNLRFASLECLETRFAETGVLFGNRQAIHVNQAIRANLRINSRESGHLSEAQTLFLGPQMWCFGWEQKIDVEKHYVFFLSRIIEATSRGEILFNKLA